MYIPENLLAIDRVGNLTFYNSKFAPELVFESGIYTAAQGRTETQRRFLQVHSMRFNNRLFDIDNVNLNILVQTPTGYYGDSQEYRGAEYLNSNIWSLNCTTYAKAAAELEKQLEEHDNSHGYGISLLEDGTFYAFLGYGE